MTDRPRCPRHDEPLVVVEEGVLNGVRRTYWGMCPDLTRGRPCRYETVVDEVAHEEPDLFGGSHG